jgi:hypothetical protein
VTNHQDLHAKLAAARAEIERTADLQRRKNAVYDERADVLRSEVSELRASLADAVGKIEVMERDLRHANILHAEDEAAIEALEQRVTDIAKGGEIIIAERDRMRADNDRLEAQVDALNARIGGLT